MTAELDMRMHIAAETSVARVADERAQFHHPVDPDICMAAVVIAREIYAVYHAHGLAPAEVDGIANIGSQAISAVVQIRTVGHA